MPRLTLQPGRLEEEHRLHALRPAIPPWQVCSRNGADDLSNPRMHHCILSHGTHPMREVNGQDVAVIRWIAHRVGAVGKPSGIVDNPGTFLGRDQIVDDDIAVADEPFGEVGRQWSLRCC